MVIWNFILLAVHLFHICEATISCKNNNNVDVDWWIIYKQPRVRNASKRSLSTGSAFVYQDASAAGIWANTGSTIDSNNTALAFTMQQWYASQTDTSIYSMLYNDETPSGTVTEARAHAKGVQLFGPDTGYWILHSVPKFPPSTSFAYPSSGFDYGQTFICASFKSSDVLTAIGKQMLFYYPEVYAKTVPSSYETAYPSLWSAVVDRKQVKQPPYSNIETVTSNGGKPFISFAKTRDWNNDLYSGLVTPFVKADMLVEGWVDGSGDLPNVCNETYKTINIASVAVGHVPWKTTRDHSKWTVADAGTTPIICIGDINRQEHQLDRGGGTLCMNDAHVWHSFRSSVVNTQPCP